ncbi:hypothetical protein BCON_0152g00100 [Botryotinia convoluta]|uniref:Uncharacterized protein n=1 Tax=Botryotinia convoluta TaxID=54673 RepID=A0A4Z1HS76_9HELO|nr:hypothetical protein BCON_0152g00100 [Botryotinia convoluta]
MVLGRGSASFCNYCQLVHNRVSECQGSNKDTITEEAHVVLTARMLLFGHGTIKSIAVGLPKNSIQDLFDLHCPSFLDYVLENDIVVNSQTIHLPRANAAPFQDSLPKNFIFHCMMARDDEHRESYLMDEIGLPELYDRWILAQQTKTGIERSRRENEDLRSIQKSKHLDRNNERTGVMSSAGDSNQSGRSSIVQ